MRDITKYINESWEKDTQYLEKAAKHIIDVVGEYIDWEKDFDAEDKDWHHWIRFKSFIKKTDLTDIEKELLKVLKSYEIRVAKNLSVDIYKEVQLIIDTEHNFVFLEGKVKSYYEKNIKK